MYDAVGRVLGKAKNCKSNDENTSFLAIIISDGIENASREFNSVILSNIMLDIDADKRWTVTYMGSNQDLTVVQRTLHLSDGNITFYNSGTSTGTRSAYTNMSETLNRYATEVSNTENTFSTRTMFHDGSDHNFNISSSEANNAG